MARVGSNRMLCNHQLNRLGSVAPPRSARPLFLVDDDIGLNRGRSTDRLGDKRLGNAGGASANELDGFAGWIRCCGPARPYNDSLVLHPRASRQPFPNL